MVNNSPVKIHVNRQSNFELLRIIAMLMIVGSHFATHGVVNILNLAGGGTGKYLEGNTANKIFVSALQPGGTVGVAIFFMISGYFLINNETAHFSKVILEGIFYGIICTCIAFALKVTHLVNYIHIGQIAQGALVSVTNGGVWWFVTVYILLMIMVPFLNTFFRKSSETTIIVTLFSIWIFPYCLDIFFGGLFTSLIKGIFYYLFGGYIRHYIDGNKTCKKWVYMLAFIMAWLIYTAYFYMIDNKFLDSRLIRIGNTLGESVFAFICSTSLFIIFKNLEYYNNIINIIASTTFAMYLISDFPLLRMIIWENVWHVQDIYLNGSFFILKAIVIIIATCSVCGFIDYIRQKDIEPHAIRMWFRIIHKLNYESL